MLVTRGPYALLSKESEAEGNVKRSRAWLATHLSRSLRARFHLLCGLTSFINVSHQGKHTFVATCLTLPDPLPDPLHLISWEGARGVQVATRRSEGRAAECRIGNEDTARDVA